MKWAKSYFIAVLLLNLFQARPYAGLMAQALSLHGHTSDVYSRAGVEGASFYALIDSKRKKISESGKDGSFSLAYPREGKGLIVEKKGYRTLEIATGNYPDSVSRAPFYVRLPLIPLDRQAHDKPYLQSEQEDFILEAQQTDQKTLTRIFKTTNALTGEPVHAATLCLNYTKVEKKDCRSIRPDSSAQKVTFLEADIVNLVVESSGYQTYRGNLILDKMDGSTGVYDIKLTPEISLLTMTITNQPVGITCQLISNEGDTTFMSKGADLSYYAFGKAGEYALLISSAQGEKLMAGHISLARGLNLHTLRLANVPRNTLKKAPAVPSPPAPVPVPVGEITALPDTIKNMTLYFTQSNYQLLPESSHQLDRLVLLLRAKPQQKILIEGHTDNVGDPYRNETLSEYRARIALKYLEERGIAPSRMEWKGMGGRKPINGNDTEEHKKMNRRVEITLLPE